MMGDMYHYPIFFECYGLREEHIKGIETYFRCAISGGGDCGPLIRLDQQRVLKRSEHVLELGDRHLVITVRESLETYTIPTATVATPENIPASSLPPSDEEYELHVDNYLLRYLKECPHAQQELENMLACLACSADLYCEEGRVLVRRRAQPGAADEVSD
uniref:uncharacterized protein LOC111500327 isoform X2 n=1 Tax=Maylandia zebra TaxID=106582 RepID=UPI000D317FC1|nr:uncharacterized protein LOC111500327 isoform X2 [Maylandia zebra]